MATKKLSLTTAQRRILEQGNTLLALKVKTTKREYVARSLNDLHTRINKVLSGKVRKETAVKYIGDAYVQLQWNGMDESTVNPLKKLYNKNKTK